MKTAKGKQIKGLLILTAAIFSVFLIFKPIHVDASWWWSDDTKEIAKFLKSHSDWLQYGSFFPFILHEIGWVVVKGLFIVTSLVEGLIPESLSLLSFLDDSGVQGITKAIINDLVVVLMVLTLVFLGFKTIIAKQPPSFKAVGVNIFISAFLLLGLPTLMDTMQDVSVKFFKGTQTDQSGESSSLAWNLIKDNTADLVYVADKGFDRISNDAEGTVKNGLKPEIFTAVDMAEVITPDAIENIKTDNKVEDLESLKYTLSTDGQGNYTATEIKDGFLSFFSDNFKTGYFRYPAKFNPIIVGLIALAIAYLFTIFIFITTVIEIGYKRVVGMFVFATDLESGQRTKMVMQDILNAFLLIAFTGLSFRMYTIFLGYLASKHINPFIYIIALISATFVLIKGSNTIMRYFGVDVGLKEGFGQMAGAFALGKTLAGGANLLDNFKKKTNGGQNNGGPGSNENMDHLNNQQESNGKSINDANKGNDRLKNGLNRLGTSYGYMAERGVGGMAEDAIKGTGEKMVNGLQNKKQALINGAQGLKNTWEDGVQDGTQLGQKNKEKWGSDPDVIQPSSSSEQQNAVPEHSEGTIKSVNDGNGLPTIKGNAEGITQPSESQLISINDGNEGQAPSIAHKGDQNRSSQAMGSHLMQNPSEGPNKSINDAQSPSTMPLTQHTPSRNDATDLNNGKQSNEQLLTTMKLNDALTPMNGQDVSGKLNLDPHVTGETAAGRLRQGVEMAQGKGQAAPADSVGGPNAASLRLNMEAAPMGNPGAAKQSLIQQVEQASIGSSDAKQRIIQELNQSTMATPPQLQQNIQSVLSAAKLPQETQHTVQKVLQEIQNSHSAQGMESERTKVIQELENASFGSKEPIRQMIIQDVQKAFTATPQQVDENIKRIVQNVEQSNLATPQQIQQNVQQVLSSAHVPTAAQEVVQKVLQDVQQGSTSAPETVKTRVLQELEKAPFENTQVRQTVIQDLQKAFSPTPEQLEQNIKQVFSSAGSTTTTNTQQNIVQTASDDKKKYFGSLWGEGVDSYANRAPVRRGKRFDAIKDL